MNRHLEEKLQRLADSPGVYLMKDDRGDVIYVGKAISLKNRVRQYFHGGRDHSPKVRAMVEKVADFDTVLAGTELEALILECNLIKHHRPRYNILLRDDKQYPYVRLDMEEIFPRLSIVRRLGTDKARYFGPYIGAHAIREVMDGVKRIFPLRTCNRDIREDSRQRPCLNAAIGQCLAPCAGRVSREEYRQVVEAASAFLQGETKGVESLFRQRMQAASDNLEYEKAALYRDRLKALERVLQRQQAVDVTQPDIDIIGLAREGDRAMACILRMRRGHMLDPANRLVEGVREEEEDTILAAVLVQHYAGETRLPREVFLSHPPGDMQAIEAFLTQRRGGRAYLRIPQRGDKKRLVDLAVKNAASGLENAVRLEKRAYERTMGAVLELQRILGLDSPPLRIEAYDNSNFQGTDAVSSLVVFQEGKPDKGQYRRFKVKTVTGANDFATMAEVVLRRFRRGLEEAKTLQSRGEDPQTGRFSHMPDLVVIDGGKGQLGAALQAMEALGVEVPTIALSEEWEEIWRPGQEEALRLPNHSEALQLLRRIRDEAHRFAVTYHRQLRGKRTVASRLEEVPGIGPARRKALLLAYPTLEAMGRAGEEELAAVKGMTRDLARAVLAHLKGGKEKEYG